MANRVKINCEYLKPVPIGESDPEGFFQTNYTVGKTILAKGLRGDDTCAAVMLANNTKSAGLSRKDFITGLAVGAGGACVGGSVPTALPGAAGDVLATHDLDVWQRETDAVTPETYLDYLGGRRSAAGIPALERLESTFAGILDEIGQTKVTGVPAVWLVYNMGVVVKTPQSLFSIDLVHRRSVELAPKLDFALITHNHGDHYMQDFYRAMNGSGKTVINNFIDNYGAVDWRKGGKDWCAHGGFTRATKVFAIRDVEIRTTLTDHNGYLVDYTTAFEIRVGGWRMYHTGDCSNVEKLNPLWGNPDLWVVFPGCGIDIAAGAKKLQPKKMSFGHLWELAHHSGRLTTPMVRAAYDRVAKVTTIRPTVPLWGERIV